MACYHPAKRGTLLFSSKLTFFCRSFSAFRTKEENPANHNLNQVGLFYNIPLDTHKILFTHGGLPNSFADKLDVFGETCLMIRKPAVDIINLMKKADYSRPPVRYVLYGKPGCGKSLSLAHIIHYAHTNGFLLLHIPWVWNWFRNNRIEISLSTRREGMYDLPLIAAGWLKHMNVQNGQLLSQLDIRLSKDYIWNQREKNDVNTPLTELIMFGINRVKYASDCVDAVINEIKLASSTDKCKTLVAIDGFNSFFVKHKTLLKPEDRAPVFPAQVTLSESFLSLTKQDWKNAAVVLTIDEMSAPFKLLQSFWPLYLLGRKGFEHIDPFIPIKVEELTEKEFESMLDYYEDRKWLQRKGGRNELSFLSNSNPYQLMNLCAPL